jgi:hypothetical protein
MPTPTFAGDGRGMVRKWEGDGKEMIGVMD